MKKFFFNNICHDIFRSVSSLHLFRHTQSPKISFAKKNLLLNYDTKFLYGPEGRFRENIFIMNPPSPPRKKWLICNNFFLEFIITNFLESLRDAFVQERPSKFHGYTCKIVWWFFKRIYLSTRELPQLEYHSIFASWTSTQG